MKDKVIFDTSFLYNKSASSFFGNEEELKKFEKVADIIIPKIVFEELENKYSRSFGQEKEKFLKTILPNIIEHNINEVVVENRIKEIIDKETIAYQIIELTDFSVLPEIKKLALKKMPPFEPNDHTDKGFKDAYIYFTILEYLKNVPNKYVFVCVKDERFKLALRQHCNIIIIENYEQFKEQSMSQFLNDYFIEKVNAELVEVEIKKEHIIAFWHNIDNNQNVLIKVEDEEYIVEVDSGEIINRTQPKLYSSNIEQLVLSSNFGRTHSSIEQLTPFVNYFSDDEIRKILEASFSNEQIKWIIEKEDVKEFIGKLYIARRWLVKDGSAVFLKKIFK
jgi:hypothetical protein